MSTKVSYIPSFRRSSLILPLCWTSAALVTLFQRMGCHESGKVWFLRLDCKRYHGFYLKLSLILGPWGCQVLWPCSSNHDKSPGGEILRSPANSHHQFVSQLSHKEPPFTADPQTLDMPSDDSSSGWQLGCNPHKSHGVRTSQMSHLHIADTQTLWELLKFIVV